jgi:ankyrin repeat protein
MANGVHPPLFAPGIPAFLAGQRPPPPPPPPVAQLALAPAKPAGNQGNPDIFNDKTLDLQVKTKISGCRAGWVATVRSLKGQERTDFLIVSFFHIVKTHGSNGNWNGAIRMIIETVEMDAMLAPKWPENMSFLHLLARIKDHEWIELALARNGVPQSLQSTDERGWSPLHAAALSGKKKIVQAILSHDDEAGSLRLKKNKENSIPLHMACQESHGSTITLLLSSKGKEQRLSANSRGCFPIHSALFNSGVGSLPYLFAECAMEQASAQLTDGRNALMLAIQAASPKAVKMLLDIPGALAVQLGARDIDGLVAIDHARLMGNAEMIALIEAAMQTAPTGVSSTASTSSTSMGNGATRLQPAMGTEPPVPMTPYPSTPAPAEQSGFSDTEDDTSFF